MSSTAVEVLRDAKESARRAAKYNKAAGAWKAENGALALMNAIDEALAALDAMAWKPIETARTDGKDLLGIVEDDRGYREKAIIFYRKDETLCDEWGDPEVDDDGEEIKYTGWMRLVETDCDPQWRTCKPTHWLWELPKMPSKPEAAATAAHGPSGERQNQPSTRPAAE